MKIDSVALTRAVRWIARKLIRLSTKSLKRGPHITRYYMYQHLREVLRAHNYSGKILSIGHSKELCKFFNLKNSVIVEANYPDYNILDLSFSDNEFDYVVSDQVLEHIKGSPQQAIDETYRVLKPGGLMILTTCFINPIHGGHLDFWRFTPEALRLLCKRFSEIIEVAGWGNPYVWLVVWLGLRYDGIPNTNWHPLHKIALLNHKDWPIVTWIVARK